MPTNFGSALDKVGMQFGSLNLAGEPVDDALDTHS
jgi:hypothetical protein